MAAETPVCDFGWQLVDASLPDISGATRSIMSEMGPNGLVVAFICNHCPYVKAVIRRIVRDAGDLKNHGIGFVAINSNDADAYPDDDFAGMRAFAAANGFSFPYLHDESQQVARAYDAACTPDFFGFNRAGQLQYRGRLDASRKEEGPADLRRDLFEAMVLVADTQRGPAEQVPSIGCSIKWKGV